jgi:hypothetical protein
MTRKKKPESRHAAIEEEEVPQYAEKVCLETATGRVR